jgi:aryl-alcohol dehydrogenase-like predicted oxidoreductase
MEKLALGTVQLGLPYGAANSTGMPSAAEAKAIVQAACDCGLPFLDTAVRRPRRGFTRLIDLAECIDR